MSFVVFLLFFLVLLCFFVLLLLFHGFSAAGMLCAAMCGARAGAVPGSQEPGGGSTLPQAACGKEVNRVKRVKKVCWRRGSRCEGL